MSAGRLQQGHVRIGLGYCCGSLADEIPQGAGLHAFLAQAGEDVCDVGQVRTVWTDEQHSTPAVAEARVGVEEIGSAMEGHDGLPGPRTTVDDERPAGTGADDGVLVGLDGAEHISHAGRAAATQARDEGGLVVERGVALEPVRAEDLVPVIADPTAGPAVPPPARQPHRVGVGRREERLGRGGAPVDQEPTTRAICEAEPSDIRGLGAVCADHAAKAEVQAVATQQAQASGQPVNLQVPIQRPLPLAPRGLALGVEALRQVSDLLLQALRDGREVLLVASNQRRVGLGDKMLGKVERSGGHEDHGIISDIDMRSRVLVAGRKRRAGATHWYGSAGKQLVTQMCGRPREARRSTTDLALATPPLATFLASR